MIDTDKYEVPKYEDAKKVVQDAGLIEENDGHPDIFYRKIAQLLAEVIRLRKAINKWEDDWCRLGDYISHYDKEMYEAIDEDIGWEDEPYVDKYGDDD